jgi:hypothetical protein
MNRRKIFQSGTGVLLITLFFAGCAGKAKTEDGEGQRYLFLDDQWINKQSGVTRTFHKADKDRNNPVVTRKNLEKGVGPYTFSWESKQSPYTAWFGTFDGKAGTYPAFYMTSPDGFNWTEATHEPSDIMTIGEGSIQCVAQLRNESGLYGDFPYFAATGFRHTPDYDTFHWRFRRSRDGIRWEAFPGDPVWDGPSDVMGIQWDKRKNKFVAYYKVWRYKGTTLDGQPLTVYGHLDTKVVNNGKAIRITGTTYLPKQKIDVLMQYGGDTSNDGGGGTSDAKMQMARVVAYAESSDFVNWENEQIIIEPSPDAPLGDQSYGMLVSCQDNMYIALYSHFNSLTGLIQPMLAWSYDGVRFTLLDSQFFMDCGKDGEWDYGYVLPSDFMDTGNGKLFLYYGSLGVDHKESDDSKLRGGLGLAWLRKDGFASLKGGRIETVPLKVQNRRMSLNMTGVIGITLKTASGETVGKTVLRGDHHRLIPDIDLSAWAGREVIVYLDLSEGELFSIAI